MQTLYAFERTIGDEYFVYSIFWYVMLGILNPSPVLEIDHERADPFYHGCRAKRKLVSRRWNALLG